MKVYRRLTTSAPEGDGYPALDVLLHADRVIPQKDAVADVPIFVDLVEDTRDRIDEERRSCEEEARRVAAMVTAMKSGRERACAEQADAATAQIIAAAAEAAVDDFSLDNALLMRLRDGLVAL